MTHGTIVVFHAFVMARAVFSRHTFRSPHPGERTMTTDKKPIPASGTKDRKASKGAEYGHDTNKSGEGNDPSLTHGKTTTRKVPPKK
jgi:hypothetical protein